MALPERLWGPAVQNFPSKPEPYMPSKYPMDKCHPLLKSQFITAFLIYEYPTKTLKNPYYEYPVNTPNI